ncbi:hypothetical protein NXT3_PA00260 (plasmid) [Sinorhizobium fredii]|uniref:Uncharacterized protein n=1 Tax=Rhizobium fredii TaxID=380 RepID=A0A2L0HCQ3_RHIFR|nr:hypothetical protein NXT3_PA00260 [Sinorhizobium fredii]
MLHQASMPSGRLQAASVGDQLRSMPSARRRIEFAIVAGARATGSFHAGSAPVIGFARMRANLRKNFHL